MIEPAKSLRDEWCDECQHGNLDSNQHPCRLCLNGGEYRYFKQKEKKKMHSGYTDMKNEDIPRYNSEPVSYMMAEPTEPAYPTVSYLGQTAMSTLIDINEKLKSIERFVDYSDTSLGDWGTPSCPDNLIHNLNCVCNALNDINRRLGLLQEKL